MAKVVIVRDLADKLGQNKSHMQKKIKRSGIEYFDVRDRGGQMVKAISIDDVDVVRGFYEESIHEIVDVEDIL